MNKIILAIALLMIISGCGNTVTGEVVREPVKVGGLFAMTSYGSEWGVDSMKGAQLAFDEEPGFELIVEDTMTSGTKTITAAQKLIHIDKVKAIVGPTWDESSLPLAPLIEEEEIITISPDSTEAVEREHDYKYFFTAWFPDRVETRALQEYAVKNNITKFAIIYNKNIYSEGMRNTFKEVSEENEIEIMQEFALPDHEIHYRTTLLKLDEDVQAIYIVFSSLETTGPFLKQVKEMGIDKMIFGSSSVESQDMIDNYGKIADGIRYPYPIETPEMEIFREKFKEKYGHYPTSPSASNAYDASKMIMEALKHNDPLAYINAEEHETISFGKVGFSRTGLIDAKTSIYRIKTIEEGRFAVVRQS